MRGEVEIWGGGKLLHKESNMLVDGAGELLADIMTVSPSLSGISDTATSSILDASNYTIQAISFGTGSDAFNKSINNAQYLDPDKIHLLGAYFGASYAVQGSMTMVRWNAVNVSSFTPEVGLPEAPDPSLRLLSKNTSVSSSFAGSGVSSDISSIFPGTGQHVNFLPSAIASAMVENTEFSALSSMSLLQSTLGAFPAGSSLHYGAHAEQLLLMAYPFDGAWKRTYSVIGQDGFFNEASSMDVSGFVNMVMSGSPNTTTNYLFSGGASGLCVSGGHDPTNSGTVEYTVGLAQGDVATVNMYGGIYHLGLWTIDMKQSLLNGNTPPFAFSILNNPRKYKLFARKGLSKNLCYIEDGPGEGMDSYTDLTIKWRLHFI